MSEENDGARKDTTLARAFRDSVQIAEKWNSLVNRIFGGLTPETPAFDRFAIRFNAATLTPFVWAGKKLGFTPEKSETISKPAGAPPPRTPT